jgi:cardiolipin synthase
MTDKNPNFVNVAVTGNAWMRNGVGSIRNLMETAFSNANNEILIAIYAISTNEEFLKMLKDTLVRGIRICMIVNKFETQHAIAKKEIMRISNLYENFILFDFIPDNDFEDLHAKIIVIDHKYALVGSANLSTNGLFRNYELMVGISGVAANQIAAQIDTLLKSKNVKRVKL